MAAHTGFLRSWRCTRVVTLYISYKLYMNVLDTPKTSIECAVGCLGGQQGGCFRHPHLHPRFSCQGQSLCFVSPDCVLCPLGSPQARGGTFELGEFEGGLTNGWLSVGRCRALWDNADSETVGRWEGYQNPEGRAIQTGLP